MGRITLFTKEDCHYCIRAKRELQYRCLPFVDISLASFPDRREDMMNLSGRLTVPQIFFNETWIGGCEDLLDKLEEWDAQGIVDNTSTPTPPAGGCDSHSADMSASILKNSRIWRKYQQEVASQPDPADPKLALPQPLRVKSSDNLQDVVVGDGEIDVDAFAFTMDHEEEEEEEANFGCINLPDGTCASIREVTNDLVEHMPRQKLAYLAKFYTDCFQGDRGVDALLKIYPFQRPGDDESRARAKAVEFGRTLQSYGILHHVCNEHQFDDTGMYYYRLQPFHQPNVLNSFQSLHRVLENMPKDLPAPKAFEESESSGSDGPPLVLTPAGALDLLTRLQKMLSNIEARVTGRDGVDFLAAKNYDDPDFQLLEEGSCQLQCLDAMALAATMTDAEKTVFGIHLYNVMVRHAYIKVGVPIKSSQRGSFFTGVCYNVANQILSLDDVEHGILRANTRHPYHMNKQFVGEDPRRAWAVSKLDPRLHFTLFCGANSCPPINTYTVENLEQELRLATEAFCQEDSNVLVDEENNTLHLSMIFKWYRKDFGVGNNNRDMAARILSYLPKRGDKYKALSRMFQKKSGSFSGWSSNGSRANSNGKDIKIKYIRYDWGSKAAPGKCLEFKSNMLKTKNVSLRAPFSNTATKYTGGGCVPAT